MRAGKPGAGLPTGFAVPVLETGSPGPGKAGAPAAVEAGVFRVDN